MIVLKIKGNNKIAAGCCHNIWDLKLSNGSGGICYFYVKTRKNFRVQGKCRVFYVYQSVETLIMVDENSLISNLVVVGAAAAVSALAQPKAGSVATAMLRANQPGTVQLSSPTSSTTAHVGPVGGLHAMQQRALIPVRPSNPVTPPATRSVSPAVTTVLHNQTDPHRYCTIMSGKENDFPQANGLILCGAELKIKCSHIFLLQGSTFVSALNVGRHDGTNNNSTAAKC